MPYLLGFSAIALAAVAGFFSVYGLSQIYAASALSVIVMGICLEIAKLVTASFLHRRWKDIKILMKSYLCFAMLVLMTITSIGVFGYLTAGYQEGSIPTTQIAQKISEDSNKIKMDNSRLEDLQKQISSISSNSVRSKRLMIKMYQPEMDSLNTELASLNKELSDLQERKLTVDAKVGPIGYVAKIFNMDSSNAIVYLTLLLVSVFDPLAVTLTIATGIAIDTRTKSFMPIEPVRQATTESEAPKEPTEDVVGKVTTPLPPVPPPEATLAKQTASLLDALREEIRKNSP